MLIKEKQEVKTRKKWQKNMIKSSGISTTNVHGV